MADENLKGLPPEERLKKLKELENKKKKEIEEAQKLIRESEEEITEKGKFKEKVPMPEFAKSDLEGLSKEAREILKEQKGLKERKSSPGKKEAADELLELSEPEKSLEELAKERVKLPSEVISPEVINSEYAFRLSQRPIQNLYEEMKKINEAVEEKGYINREEERRVEYLASAVEKKIEAEESGRYSFTEETALAANITQQMGARLIGSYKGKGNSWYKV